MNKPSIAILTGPGSRHAYFARELMRNFDVKLVIVDSLEYPSPPGQSPEEKKAWDWFFNRRDEYEQRVFGPAVLLDDDILVGGNIHICSTSINHSSNLDLLKSAAPDAIAVFGTGILGSDILSHFGDRVFNFHPGLTWTHRGSSCNFWPILENRLDCLGATIIKINQGIDTGEIYDWGTIRIEPEDDAQSLIGKTILLGTRLMIEVLKRWMDGKAFPLERKGNGSLYLMKDLKPSATLELKNRVDSGELAKEILAFSKK